MLRAFTSHLDKELYYTITVVVRKDKYNITLIKEGDMNKVQQELLIDNFEQYITILINNIKYIERLISIKHRAR
jgi:hypothetical protein